MTHVIEVENLSKHYKLGLIGADTLREEVAIAWAKFRGKTTGLVDAELGGVGDIWALRDVNFNVSDGEVLGIVGGNGAGKSTLLKILSRITAPTTGAARLRGRVGALLEVGTGFHPELTGRENIFLNGAILGMTRTEVQSKLEEIVDFSGVAKFIDTPVKRYSSGMTVRLAFAVAAHLDPEILIVDEVLAVGDAAFQRKCIGTMQDVADSGRTVLVVSHNMATISRLCSRCIYLESGEVIIDGAPELSIARYFSSRRDVATDELHSIDGLNIDYTWVGKPGLKISRLSLGLEEDHQIGDPVSIRLGLQSEARREDLKVSYSVRDLGGATVLSGFSQRFCADSGSTELELVLRNLPLAPGDYSFSVSVVDSGDVSVPYHSLLGFGLMTVHGKMRDGQNVDWRADWGNVMHIDSDIRVG